jgi:CheY-like chemotaxis protein
LLIESIPRTEADSISRVHFLEALESSAPRTGGEPVTDTLNRRAKPRDIIVIDDEQSIADTLAEILTQKGFRAFPFYDGDTAIQFASTQCPDIVLTDVVMPKLNGIETAVAIRKLCPDARIMLFSGQAGTGNLLQQAREKGQNFELLPKPLHPEVLLNKLSKA